MILKGNKIFLGKRHENPEKASSLLNGAGIWTTPRGKLHFGETFEEGTKRETMEETGITLNNIKVIGVNKYMVLLSENDNILNSLVIQTIRKSSNEWLFAFYRIN